MKIGIGCLLLAIILLVIDCVGGKTEQNVGTVDDTSYQEAYTDPAWKERAYTDDKGVFHAEVYHPSVYHPAEYGLHLTFDDDDATWVNTNERAYNQAYKGQKVPYECRRGKWSHHRWLDSYNP